MEKRIGGEKNTAFSILEVLVALVLVSLVTLLILSLSKEVMRIGKTGRRMAGLTELRARIGTTAQDLPNWLVKMRTAIPVYGTCLPTGTGPYTCPAAVAATGSGLDQTVVDLANAGGVPYITPTIVVDNLSTQVAGTVAAPFYLNIDGVACLNQTSPAADCPMRSIGYFMRQNQNTNVDPGNVSFVVNLESNPAFVATAGQGLTPFKPQLVSMNVGTAWKATAGTTTGTTTTGTTTTGTTTGGAVGQCPSGQVMKGINTNNTVNCGPIVVPAVTCPAPGVLTGFNSSGAPICTDIVTTATYYNPLYAKIFSDACTSLGGEVAGALCIRTSGTVQGMFEYTANAAGLNIGCQVANGATGNCSCPANSSTLSLGCTTQPNNTIDCRSLCLFL